MYIYSKILVPLDGSELAEVALPYAEGLASKFDAELALLGVEIVRDVVIDNGKVSGIVSFCEIEKTFEIDLRQQAEIVKTVSYEVVDNKEKWYYAGGGFAVGVLFVLLILLGVR